MNIEWWVGKTRGFESEFVLYLWVRTCIWLKAHSSCLGSCLPLCCLLLSWAWQYRPGWLRGVVKEKSGTEIRLNKIDHVWEEKQVFILLCMGKGRIVQMKRLFPFNLVLEKCHTELFCLLKQISSSGFLAGTCSQCPCQPQHRESCSQFWFLCLEGFLHTCSPGCSLAEHSPGHEMWENTKKGKIQLKPVNKTISQWQKPYLNQWEFFCD